MVEQFDDPRIREKFGEDPVYAEQVVPFDKELSVVVARDTQGLTEIYPAVETVHQDNICHTVVSTEADQSSPLMENARRVARQTLQLLEGAGVFAIELFAVGDEVMVNEIAPRVHNSGHHTIEANATSQFEQHIRAITGMPLGKTSMRVGAAAMINILGNRDQRLDRQGLEKVLAFPDTHVHFYGKDPRPARKVGHITILGSKKDEVTQLAHKARKELII